MGFDLFGESEEENGKYFRNNVWYWRPLWDFTCTNCSNILSENDRRAGHYNDGYKITKSKARKLGSRLNSLIKDGTVDFYVREHTLMLEQSQAKNDIIDKKKKVLKQEVKDATGKDNIVPDNFPEPFLSKWNKLQEQKDWSANYPFDRENVEEFAEFCLASDGFNIC